MEMTFAILLWLHPFQNQQKLSNFAKPRMKVLQGVFYWHSKPRKGGLHKNLTSEIDRRNPLWCCLNGGIPTPAEELGWTCAPWKTKGPMCNTSQFPRKKWRKRPLHMHPSKMSIPFRSLTPPSQKLWYNPRIRPSHPQTTYIESRGPGDWSGMAFCDKVPPRIQRTVGSFFLSSHRGLTIQKFSQPVDTLGLS